MPTDPAFQFTIEDIFSIKGRGTVVTGKIAQGVIQVGDAVQVMRVGVLRRRAQVKGIEAFKKTLTRGEAGQMLGLLLGDVDRVELEAGDVLVADTAIDVQDAPAAASAPSLPNLIITEVDAPKPLPAWVLLGLAALLLAAGVFFLTR